ncbi:uncharacterized protein PHALS_05368 [Plasmopara halstedii]|uniref:Uncharacterized protein n=1 Tax=Plasmopara halstedii TaxID=4781 RepID=A0A0P1AA14_PLAHL|nr:uncharacterized protein PHALS_05368 [Plasmopara halstedii]CEG37589.1 hypothetical protein PHALS_05368 [Plasmopara halstedii]|eukprot:XP_024573958.1 hypothetical protein PHALS_05368 [Plasmopara halstedii]
MRDVLYRQDVLYVAKSFVLSRKLRAVSKMITRIAAIVTYRLVKAVTVAIIMKGFRTDATRT